MVPAVSRGLDGADLERTDREQDALERGECPACGANPELHEQMIADLKRQRAELIEHQLLQGQRDQLLLALEQMFSAFDTPIARRRDQSEWAEASRQYAREVYNRIKGIA